MAANGSKYQIYYVIIKDLKYIVRYVDKETEQEINDPKTVKNVVYGTEVDLNKEIIDIEGYTYDSMNVEKVVVKDNKNEIIIYYTANQGEAILEGNVEVSYVDGNGKEIAEKEIMTGELDSEFVIKPKEIPGYKLVEVKGNTVGKYTEETQKVGFVYEEIPHTGIESNNIMLIISTLSLATLLILKKKIFN